MDWESLVSDAETGDTKQRLAVLPALQVGAELAVVLVCIVLGGFLGVLTVGCPFSTRRTMWRTTHLVEMR